MIDSERTLNLKVLGRLLAVLVLLGVSVVSVHALQVRRHAGLYKSQAVKAAEAGRLAEAAKYYARYLDFVPEDYEAHVAYARVLDKKAGKSVKDLRALIDLYETLLRRNANDDESRRGLVDAEMALRRYADAQFHIRYLLNNGHENDGRLHRLYAVCYAFQNDTNRAIGHYQKSIACDRALLESYVELAALYDRVGQSADADKAMDGLIKANKENYQAHLARARHLERRGQAKFDEMGKEIEQAYALAKDKEETLQAMAELEIKRQHPALARQYLTQGIERFPHAPAMFVALADLELRARRMDDAVACLRRGIKQVPAPARNGLLHLLARCAIERGDKEEARNILNTLVQANAAQAGIDDLNARLLIAQGQWKEATNLLENSAAMLAASTPAGADLSYLLGQCYEKRGEPDRALSAYKNALAVEPGLTPARAGVASSLLALGRSEEALREYKEIVAEMPELGSKMAQILIPQNLRLEKPRRNWQETERALAAAEQAAPGSVEVILARLQALLAQDRNVEAQALIAKRCAEQPTKIELWLASAGLADAQGDRSRALAVLAQAEEKLGDRVEWRLARAWHWSLREKKDAKEIAPLLRGLEEGTDHFSTEEKAQLLRGLGDVYAGAGNYEDARRLWRATAALLPQDLQIRLTLFDLAIQQEDTKSMEKLTDEIKALDSDGTLWRLTKAKVRVAGDRKLDQNARAEATALLLEVVARRKLWGAPLRALAALDEMAGKEQQALEKYEQALELGDRNSQAVRRVIALLCKQERYSEANQLWQRWDPRGELFEEGRRTGVLSFLQQGNVESAVQSARQTAQASKDIRDQVFLGQVLWLTGEKKYEEEALRVLRTAVHSPQAEKAAGAWVVLVQVLSAAKQTAEAHAVIEEARRRLPRETASQALAQCFEALAEFDRAAAEFERALKDNPYDVVALRGIAGFYQRRSDLGKAQPYLVKLLDPQTNSTEADRAAARRGIALYLSAQGDYQHLQEARKLIEENTRVRGTTAADQATLAVVEAAHPQTRREAIRLLENLQGGQPTLEQRNALAMLYEATRDWQKAHQAFSMLATSALAAKPPRFDYVASAARALLRRGESGEAAIWLDKLTELDPDPDSPYTLDIHVRVLKAQDRVAEAAALLAAYADKPNADQRLAARLYEEMGLISRAERLYRQLVNKEHNPPQLLALAQCLVRQGKVDEALEVCESVARMGRLDLASDMGIAALRRRPPTEAQCRRVEGWLNEIVNGKSGSQVRALMQLAALWELRQSYAQAEIVYREVLQREPRNSSALNNLAWLLALRGEKLSEALELINRALEFSGKWPTLLDTRAKIHLKQGDTRNALADLDAALLDVDDAAFYFHRAEVLAATNPKAARANFQKSLEMKTSRESLHPLERQAFDHLQAAFSAK
ncbi:MAG TPA: tetratricopeptide repeat protein [Gemmataceae bacterium]|nr:tetratricopeptide repeat protein [Gemmataceae bacterium]